MTTQDPVDLFELRHAATDHATFVVVPERTVLAIDGVGGPAGADYRFASDVLHDVSDALARRLRRLGWKGARPGTLETAWWVHPELPDDAMAAAFADRTTWHWQQMVEVPATATAEDVDAAIDETRLAAGRPTPLVRVVDFPEGRAAQILHAGDTGEVAGSVRRLYAAVAEGGFRPRGHLHEIRLADAGHVPPERVRSIIRLPIEPA